MKNYDHATPHNLHSKVDNITIIIVNFPSVLWHLNLRLRVMSRNHNLNEIRLRLTR